MVAKTVVLEFEGVMRGYYGLPAEDIVRTLRHLLALPHVTDEDRDTVAMELSHCAAGLDFADACIMQAIGVETQWHHSTTSGSPGGRRKLT